MDTAGGNENDKIETVLVHALRTKVIQGKKYTAGELYTVDMRTGKVQDNYLGAPPLLNVDSLTRLITLGSTVYILGRLQTTMPNDDEDEDEDEAKEKEEEEQVIENSHFKVSCFSPDNTSWESLPSFFVS